MNSYLIGYNNKDRQISLANTKHVMVLGWNNYKKYNVFSLTPRTLSIARMLARSLVAILLTLLLTLIPTLLNTLLNPLLSTLLLLFFLQSHVVI